MEKRDKRVVGAVVAAAIIVAIGVLAVGWFVVGRDDARSQAGVSVPGATATANGESNGGTPQTATGTAPGQDQSSQAASASSEAGTGTTSSGQPSNTPANGVATGNLLTAPSTGTAPASDTAPAGQNTNASSSAANSTPTQTDPQATNAADADAAPAGRTVLTDDQVAALPPIMPPSFDVVRVNELGDAVIAGRAEPRSVVIIFDGDREIGRVVADSRGEWVFISDRPLVPGQHEIGLLSQAGPQSRLSDQVVVLIAPEPRQDIAGQPSEGDREREKPLALLVPRGEIGATTVLQSPPAGATDDPASRVGQPAIASSTTTAPANSSGANSSGANSSGAGSSGAGSSGAPGSTAGDEAPVSIDVVDYDEAGRLIVSGRSTPQSDVRLYLDNEFVGTARTDSDGSFQVQPTEPVEPGVYALRVDEVSPVGSVTARAETPFQRASEIAESLPGHSRIIVQPGNSLWRIARQVYGQGVQYTVIYQANTGQIRDPDLIYPGQIFNVPEMPTEVPAGDPS